MMGAATAKTRREAWRAKTDAQLHDPHSFRALAAERELVLVGLMGYAGSWRRSGLQGDALRAFVADARRSLRAALSEAQEAHGERLVMVSGATNIGVLELAYELCAELGITAMGVTSSRALRYRLAPMDYLIAIGSRFGDESACFVELCARFIVLGGGSQSLREAESALAQGKAITVIRGFGGAADELAGREGAGVRVLLGRGGEEESHHRSPNKSEAIDSDDQRDLAGP